MVAYEKLLARMRNNPRDWRIDDLKSVANRLGIDWRNEGGSHHVFSYPGVEEDVCVPAHRPIKPVYVRHFVALAENVVSVKANAGSIGVKRSGRNYKAKELQS